ncbi:MAG: hypothetical protein KF847_11005 [Pirellulales bacterium]|nr:hypothetical protein [Pirellulales bacterium]
MSANSPSEVQLFHDFIGPQIAAGRGPASLEAAIEQFREHQRQLSDLKDKIRVAEEQSAAGQSAPFDIEATKAALRTRLAAEGR